MSDYLKLQNRRHHNGENTHNSGLYTLFVGDFNVIIRIERGNHMEIVA